MAEDREEFRRLMKRIEMPIPRSASVNSLRDALKFADKTGYPLIVRPGFTLGGTGGGIAYNRDELADIANVGLMMSLNHQILVEQCVVGWKEIEYEVMRDANDNCITVCNMENLDPMGVHTGDSMVVAPSLTLSDNEYQLLRTASLTIIRALKIEGGCNVQYALSPTSLEFFVIEVNPRVSRSSALASKATGYPIARVAAKIALGLHLDEITNSVTGKTMASFEPALDYVVMKIPKWPFDKFRGADKTLGTQMKATGEVMSIDRTFEGAFLKALSSLEVKLKSFRTHNFVNMEDDALQKFLTTPTDSRVFAVFEVLARGWDIERIRRLTNIDPFFLKKFRRMVDAEAVLKRALAHGDGDLCEADRRVLHSLKRDGMSDDLLASALGTPVEEMRKLRGNKRVRPTFKSVDTCAAEFAATTPYYYSSYDGESDKPAATAGQGDKCIVVLGSGPIRIGQGIEFDYCSVHALKALRRLGYRAAIINNNPETVSTDFDASDTLYFEPLTLESVLEILRVEKPLGVIVQFGGQTAINLAIPLAREGVNILGTTVEGIDETEDRRRFDALMAKLKINRPKGAAITNYSKAVDVAREIGFPVLVRPSYVLGGRAMEIVYTEQALSAFVKDNYYAFMGNPILIDEYHPGKEVEVDVISDGESVIVPGIMEHIERAGVHSGDSMAVYPPQTLADEHVKKIVECAESIARRIRAVGLINIQFVVSGGEVYVLEVNPRASRTVPFISKITGVPMIQLAIEGILGQKFAPRGIPSGLYPVRGYVAVKAPVFSFAKMRKVDVGLGPEMKSTGEVMGIARDFPTALIKAMTAAGFDVPALIEAASKARRSKSSAGGILATVADPDKEDLIPIVQGFSDLGFKIRSTQGTADFLNAQGVEAEAVKKLAEGRPNILDYIRSGEFKLLINTISDNKIAEADALLIRREAVEHNIPVLTSLDTARALLASLNAALEEGCHQLDVVSLNEVAAATV
jgi:carbamoyl-phosphate synthase large subunit